MSKCRKAHVTVRGRARRQAKISSSPCSIPCSPPSLVPCCLPESHIPLKHQRIRKFALEIAVSQITQRKTDENASGNLQPTAAPSKAFSSSANQEFKTVYPVDEHQKAQLRSLFDWMCEISPSQLKNIPRRSKRLSHCT